MTRSRLTIAQLMISVAYLAFSFEAIRNANTLWASATYSLAVSLMAAAVVFAFARKGRERVRWIGFATFNWTYFLVSHLPAREHGSLGFGPIRRPMQGIEWAFSQLYTYPNFNQYAGGDYDLISYEHVSLSLGVIFVGLAGALLGHLASRGQDHQER